MMKRLPIILVFAIPAAAVLMGAITMYLAFQGPDQEIRMDGEPMSKTSWRSPEAEQ